MKTTHQLIIRNMKLLQGGGPDAFLLTSGLDGRINICPAGFGGPAGGGQIEQKQLFHYQRGGVVRAEVMREGFCAVDGRGALAVFEVRSRSPASERERIAKRKGGRGLKPYSTTKERSEPSPERPFVSELMAVGKAQEQQRGVIGDIEEEEPLIEQEQQQLDKRVAKTSWSERKEASDLLRDRRAYEGEIADIERSLASIKEQVGTLLVLNEELPAEERLERSEFELNSEEKQRRWLAGQEKEAGLRLELKAWQAARKKAGLNIRKEVWDDLEVPGRAIRSLQGDVVVRNYPLLPATAEELEELAAAQGERKTARDFRHLSDQMQQDPSTLQQELPATVSTPRTARGSDSLRASSRQQQQHSPRDPSPSPRALSRRGGAGVGDSTEASSSDKKDGRFLGSVSHELIGFDGAQQLDQWEVKTRMQIKQQIALLKVKPL